MARPPVPMPSLSARERGCPPPRRKSCAACATAKRRCSNGRPACVRCSQRGIACVYPAAARMPHVQDEVVGGAAFAAQWRSGDDEPNAVQQSLQEEHETWTPSLFPGFSSAFSLPMTLASSALTDTTDVVEAPPVCVDNSYTTATAATTTWLLLSAPGEQQSASTDLFLPNAVDTSNNMSRPPTFSRTALSHPLGLHNTEPEEADGAAGCGALTLSLSATPRTPLLLAPSASDARGAYCQQQRNSAFADLDTTATSRRLMYAIQQLQDAPRLLVASNGLPWSHPQLYRDAMPAVVQDVLASCALYAARNVTNECNVARVLGGRLELLLAEPVTGPGETDGCSLLLWHLARTQALLLYNIMGVFGSAGAGANYASSLLPWPLLERARSALLDAAFRLLPLTRALIRMDGWPHHSGFDSNDYGTAAPPPPPLPLFPLAAARRAWEVWVTMESARRTCLLAIYMSQLHRSLVAPPPAALSSGAQNKPPCDKNLYLGASWTVSAALWHAADPVDFARAWNDADAPPFVPRDADLAPFVARGRARDADDFTKILLSSMIGAEAFKGWMAARA